MEKKDNLKVCNVCSEPLKDEQDVYVVGREFLCSSCVRDLVFRKEK